MSFSEFITHPIDPQICSTQPKQPKFSIHNKEENSETDPAQQKQRKKLILNDVKNIFTYCFQPVQGGLQPILRLMA